MVILYSGYSYLENQGNYENFFAVGIIENRNWNNNQHKINYQTKVAIRKIN